MAALSTGEAVDLAGLQRMELVLIASICKRSVGGSSGLREHQDTTLSSAARSPVSS